MGNPTLTKLLFAGLLVTFVAATLFSNYATFAIYNNASIDEPYASIFQDIANQQQNLTAIGNTVKDRNLVTTILNLGQNLVTGTVNVFVVGLNAIGTFFEMIPILGNILSAISLGLPGLSGLIGLLTLILGIYVAMKYIQSVSNKQDLP